MYTQEHTLSLDMTDTALAEQALSGDQKAFEALVQRYQIHLFNFISHFLGDENLANDVLQEVLLRLYISLPRLKMGVPFQYWLFRVARNCCVDELRRKKRAALPFSQLEAEKRKDELTSLYNIPDPGPLPEEAAERLDLQVSLQDAIQTLPPKFRSVVLLRYTSQLRFSEISQILSIPEARAKTYFHRAKPLLRKRIVAHL